MSISKMRPGELEHDYRKRLAREQVPSQPRPGESFVSFDRRQKLAAGEIDASSTEALSEQDRLHLASIRASLQDGSWRGVIPARLMPHVQDLMSNKPVYDPATAQQTSREFVAAAQQLERDIIRPTSARQLATDQALYVRSQPMSRELRQAMGNWRSVPSETLNENMKRLGYSISQRMACSLEASQRGLLTDSDAMADLSPIMSDALQDVLLGQAVPMTEAQFHARCKALGHDAVHSMGLMIEAYQHGKVRPDDEGNGAPRPTHPDAPRTVDASGKKLYRVAGHIQACTAGGVAAYDKSAIWFDDAPRPREQRRSALYVC